MAYRTSPERASKARASSFVTRVTAGLTLSVCAYAGLAGATGGHRAVDALELPPPPVATLSFEGADPVITGSVATLFGGAAFAGPNRSERTARVRPEIDIVTFAQGFDAARLSIAEARATAAAAEEERIAVAAVDPGRVQSDSLRAIDALAGGAEGGASASPDLAYARPDAPVTEFTPKHTYSEREQWCLATGIYFEARGESYRGQVAVAQVIMNRVGHPNYPNTICGVVYQNQHRRNACQFSFACDGKTNVNRTPEVVAWARAQDITRTVLNKDIYLPEVADATHYHATYVNPRWARNMDRLTQIGLHIFYRFKPGWRYG